MDHIIFSLAAKGLRVPSGSFVNHEHVISAEFQRPRVLCLGGASRTQTEHLHQTLQWRDQVTPSTLSKWIKDIQNSHKKITNNTAVLLSKADEIDLIVGLYRTYHIFVHQLFFWKGEEGIFGLGYFFFSTNTRGNTKNNFRKNRIPDTGLALN